jgi:hypothetical protein
VAFEKLAMASWVTALFKSLECVGAVMQSSEKRV